MAKFKFTKEDFENNVIMARLAGGRVRIPTGSPSSAKFSLTFPFDLGEGYHNIDQDCPPLANTYREQFEIMDSLLRVKLGQGFKHAWVSLDGRNFIIVVGDLYEPKVIWRRIGAGKGTFNTVYFKGEKYTVGFFVRELEKLPDIPLTILPNEL